jgi:hypothetical protein
VAYTTTDTFSSLVDEVITSLQGFGTNNDQVCTLTSNMTAGDLSFTVDESDNISRGIIEIDDEILYVSYGENGTVYVPAFGRGFKGTAPIPHTAGVAVWVSPTWPRSTVAREVNNTIRSLYPSLFAVGTVDIQSSSTNYQYELPTDLERVLSVEWKWNYPNSWNTVKSWETIHSASVTDFPSGKALMIGDPLPINATIHVTYAKIPSVLPLSTSLFTDSGLPASARDVVVLGTAARLIPWQDTSRLPVESVPSDALDLGKPVGTATQVANAMRTMYQTRLDQERRAQLDRYPTRAHRTR